MMSHAEVRSIVALKLEIQQQVNLYLKTIKDRGLSPMSDVVDSVQGALDGTRERLVKYVCRFPVARWASRYIGITLAAGLHASMDGSYFPSPEHVWRVMGLDQTRNFSVREARDIVRHSRSKYSDSKEMLRDIARITMRNPHKVGGDPTDAEVVGWILRPTYSRFSKLLVPFIADRLIEKRGKYHAVYVQTLVDMQDKNERGELTREAERALSKRDKTVLEDYPAYLTGRLPKRDLESLAKMEAVRAFAADYAERLEEANKMRNPQESSPAIEKSIDESIGNRI